MVSGGTFKLKRLSTLALRHRKEGGGEAFDERGIWGIGRQISAHLKRLGIRSAYDLLAVDPRWMRKHFTVVGERLLRELQGIPYLPS
jgi:nucleotidyltransferase/DNA polymerase involved in DNA repair